MKREKRSIVAALSVLASLTFALTGFGPILPKPKPSPKPSPTPTIKPSPSPTVKPSPTPSPTPTQAGQVPDLRKVMIVLLENESQESAVKQPFLASLLTKSGVADNYHGLTHPSEPNYVGLASGSTHGIKDDGVYNLDGRSLADLLEARGLTWKTYAEDYPGNCFAGSSKAQYMRKHNPFISFKNISGDSKRCAKIVNSKVMDADIASGTLPNFSFYIPNDDNNGHDTGVAFADKWLKSRFEKLLADPRFAKDMTFIVTFDESSGSSSTNHIYAIFTGEQVRAGSVTNVRYNHYDLLRTVEDGFGIGTLGLNDQAGNPILGIWK